MTSPATAIRPARREDATVLAALVDYAGEGLPRHLWSQLATDGETADDVGRRRAERDEGSFSYRNATVIDGGGGAVGCLIGYEIADEPLPVDPDMPAMFVPLQELENLAPGTWYVNVLAVLPSHRRHGFGSRLLEVAEATAGQLGKRGLSVIVADANAGARRLYERHGYRERARRDMIKNGWRNDSRQWILMVKAM